MTERINIRKASEFCDVRRQLIGKMRREFESDLTSSDRLTVSYDVTHHQIGKVTYDVTHH